MIVADAVAEYLVSKGCTHAFGIVGGASLALYEAIGRYMTLVAVMQEQGAAIASAAYYRHSGRIAPCLVTAGGGCANAFTGVIDAQQDSVPILVISGAEMTKFYAPPRTRNIGFQGFDVAEYVRPFTKYSHLSLSGRDTMDALDKAFMAAVTPRQGAAWLDVPQDVARGSV